MPLFSNPARHRGINTGLHYSLFGGRITVGPDWKSVLGSLAIILAPAGIYFGFIASDNGHDQSWAVPAIVAALTAASIALLLTTACLDPGFLPRNDDPIDTELGERPNSKEHEVRGYTVTTKWCVTCNHYRPPRCSHCAICDNCTRKFDHHCPWVGNCIGERNYRFFMAFLIVTTALDALVHAFCWVRLVYITQHGDHPSFGTACKREPAALALIAYTFFAFGFVGGLSGLHTFFISTNRTTYEHFRARYGGSGNPYSHHCPGNWADVCFTRLAPRYPENLVIPARANGNAYSSVYDTQTSLPESGPPQREGIIDSRNSDQIASEHMASDRQQSLIESGLAEDDRGGARLPPGMAARAPGGDYVLADQRDHPLQSSYPPPRQRGAPIITEAHYTSTSAVETEDGASAYVPHSGSSGPGNSPRSPGSSFDGQASQRVGDSRSPMGLATPPSERYGLASGDEYVPYSPHLRPEGLQLAQYGGNSSTGMSDEDDFINTVPYEPQLAPAGIELQGYAGGAPGYAGDGYGQRLGPGRPQTDPRQVRAGRVDPAGGHGGSPLHTGGMGSSPPYPRVSGGVGSNPAYSRDRGGVGGSPPYSREHSQGRLSREPSAGTPPFPREGWLPRQRSWQGPDG